MIPAKTIVVGPSLRAVANVQVSPVSGLAKHGLNGCRPAKRVSAGLPSPKPARLCNVGANEPITAA
jgi:hypothetical protein